MEWIPYPSYPTENITTGTSSHTRQIKQPERKGGLLVHDSIQKGGGDPI
jgi:hypothetical protein